MNGKESYAEIYHFDDKIAASVKSIKKSRRITARNKELILNFKEHMEAEGLSLARILYYMYRMKRIAHHLKKDFDKATKSDLMQLVARINTEKLNNGHEYSEKSKKDFAVSLSKFYRWLNGNGEDKPDILKGKWLVTAVDSEKCLKVTKKDLITPTEVKSLINAANCIRDEAFIMVLYESGARCGEMISMKIDSIEWDSPTTIHIDGKTGERDVCIGEESQRLIKEWLKKHPKKDNPNSYLWVTEAAKILSPAAVSQMLKRTARRSGLKRKIWPHLFRHTRATELAKSMNPVLLCKQFGWKPHSRMPSVYLHLDTSDLKDDYANSIGEKKVEKEKIASCPKCDKEVKLHQSVCLSCGQDLDFVSVQITKKEKREDENLKKMALEMLQNLLASESGKKYLEEKRLEHLQKLKFK